MRIIIIHRSYALVGGAERVLSDKANYLSEYGNHEIMLVSYEQGTHPLPYQLHPSVKYKDLDCRFFTLSKYSVLTRLYHYYRLRRKFKSSLRKLASEFRPDVVVLASDWQILITSVLQAVSPVPVIAEFHNAYDYIMRNVGVSESSLKRWIIRSLHWQTLKHLDKCAHMVVLTESDARCWRHHFNNVCVIPNPVAFYPDAVDDIPKDPGRIIFVGRFNHEKRIDRLVTAFSQLADNYPQWHVDIFGEGNEKELIEQKIRDYHLEDRVIIHNPTKAIVDEYKRSEMLVLCSEHEARPLVLVEAMACGVPCVALDCPFGPREIITDGVTGLLARDGDVQDLAAKIEWMIVHNEERQEMSRRAREDAAQYKMSVIMKYWEELYTGVTIDKSNQ